MTQRAKSRRRTGSVTFEEFCERVSEDQKADLIDGVIYMASPENLDANDLFAWLFRLIGDYVEERELGRVYGSRVAFRMEGTSGPEPDVAFVRKDRLGGEERSYFDGAPDLAVEIVSPESVERDYETKRLLYQKHGVEEYWIVDEHEQLVTFLRLGTGRTYREVKLRKGVYHSTVLPGFWLRPAWLWQEPRPKKAAVLNEILGR